MLACYLAETGQYADVNAAVIISAPLMLEPCSIRLEKGISQFYERYLLNSLKRNTTRKLIRYPGSLPLNLLQLKKLKRLRDFDNAVTAKIHSFKDATDYYH